MHEIFGKIHALDHLLDHFKTNNMAQQNENNELYDLEDLRSEYESTYLAYALFAENADFMNFEQWLEKHKGLKIK